ncbi:MAG: hypothetical protein RG741_09040 [Bacteroidales bacterium]|nr:hypothetical protein [Bacteroidales bacterium]
MIIIVAVIALSINGLMAHQSESTLKFWNSFGEELIQPVMKEEAIETPPLDIRCEFERLRTRDVYRTFDLSELVRPEEEQELPLYIERILHSAK